jgi:predicted amidohydrolase
VKIAVGQFAASEEWQPNAAQASELIRDAGERGADLLVLPEGVLTRFTENLGRIRDTAQPLDGPFVELVRRATVGFDTTVVLGVHERSGADVFNTLLVLRDGSLVATYRKLHLYDAFGAWESDNITSGDAVPAPFPCAGLRVGLMTCYDVRFPEAARLQTLAGADVIALPAAWVRGPQKERHWELMVAARALENTCYVVASGECGPRNIGSSMVVDPMGVVVSRLGQEPGMAWTHVSSDRLQEVRRHLPVLANRRFEVDPTPRAGLAPPAPDDAAATANR